MPRLFDLLSDDARKEMRSKLGHDKPRGKRGGKGPRHTKENRSKGDSQGMRIPDYVALDCETTGLDSRVDRITEIAAVRFTNGKPGEEFSTLVNPGRSIPPEITRLTGIRDSDVAEAPRFPEICGKLLDFIGNSHMCGHQVEFDANFINEELKRIGKERLKNSLLDTAVLSRTLLPEAPGYSLGQVSTALKVSLETAHRALDDARASGEVAALLVPKLADIPSAVRARMAAFCPGSLLKSILNRSITFKERQKPTPRVQDVAPFENLGLPEKPKPIDRDEVARVLSEEGSLAKAMSGYEPRDPQIAMARDVAKAFNTDTFLVAEAGTGVGKTLGYLVPAAMWAQTNTTRVLVSTRTRNLQDQLMRKDLPIIKELLGGSFRFAALKGRSNYLCFNRWNRLLSGRMGNLSPRERFGVLPLLIWAEQTQSGDIEEQNQFNRRWFSKVWNLISADSQECVSWKCPYASACFLQKARRRALNSNIVVINHALFFSEVCSESSFLGAAGPIIFDEAHHLEASGHQHLRVEIDTNRVNRYTEILDNLLKSLLKHADTTGDGAEDAASFKSVLKRLRKAGGEFLKDCEAWALRKAQVQAGAYQFGYSDNPFAGLPGLATFEIALRAMQDAIGDVHRTYGEEKGQTGELASDIPSCVERTSQLKADLAYLASAVTEDHVFWIEGNASKGWVKLCGVPLDVGGLMAQRWDTHNGALVFTSATLSVSGEMEYFRRKVGLTGLHADRTDTRIYHSPFVDEQMLKYALVSELMPDAGGYTEYVADCISQIARKLKKKNILVLFTSNAMMDATYNALGKSSSLPKEVTVLAQSAAASRHVLLEQFREADWAVLCGTDSFWEGIDVPGNACEVVVMPRLPFQVPTHPLTQAIARRHEEVDGESFFSYSVPEAVIKFRQGAGRLIRTPEDHGMLLVLDSRIATKGYGKKFMRSLDGEFRTFHSIDEVVQEAALFFGS